MSNVITLVDGFNLYHAINNHPYKKYKWLNLKKLSQAFITRQDTLTGVYYFTALATWSATKTQKHKTYIKALQSEGIEIVFGEFKRKDKNCTLCKRRYRSFEEKQTDVNIALNLFRLALQDKYDKAIIISGDSDLIPAINAVQSTFPEKKIGVVIPIARASESLKRTCDFHMKMKEKHLATSLFSKTITNLNNTSIICPEEWE